MTDPGDVISYRHMCDLEGINTLQRGMNFRLRPSHSVVLMSRRSNAPYRDSVSECGRILMYEGHDVPKSATSQNPKQVDQSLELPSGKPTQNGLFWKAAHERGSTEQPELVRVYEKLFDGVWVYNGLFALRDADQIVVDGRKVCRFRLEMLEVQESIGDGVSSPNTDHELPHTRMIPTSVKQAVWKRDGGQCVECGSKENLHFDHIVPFSRGGSSLVAENIQLLCAKHNYEKSARIM